MEEIFKPRGMNDNTRAKRSDGWVGGRADTWMGHYKEVPASRVSADARRMANDHDYSSQVAETIRRKDEAIVQEMLDDASLSIEPASPSIGVVVHGVDLADPSDAQIDAIKRLYLEAKVVFFRDQGHISREEHIAFGRRISDTGLAYGRQNFLARRELPDEHPEILRLYANEERPFAASNWHSDVTWSDRPRWGRSCSRESHPRRRRYGVRRRLRTLGSARSGTQAISRRPDRDPRSRRSRRGRPSHLSDASRDETQSALRQSHFHQLDHRPVSGGFRASLE